VQEGLTHANADECDALLSWRAVFRIFVALLLAEK